MVAFYNAGDQELYKNYQYLPQERYRLGLNLPKTEQDTSSINTNFGIPATDAFTNTGNNNFNFQSGNAFGYGSPVSEVNVRTFNPQPYGTGVESAQAAYNQANQALAQGMDPNTQGYGSFTGGTLEGLKNIANEIIMDNKEQYGAQGQYVSPYDDTVDQSKYTTTIGSFPSRAFFNRLRNKGVNLSENIPYIGPAVRVLKGFLPEKEDRGPGGGTYGIGGLSDAQKTYYNALAKEGYLFSGNQGFKTLTGKNFNLSDKQFDKYVSGQIDFYNKEFTKPDGTMMTEEEIEDVIDKTKADPRKQFKYKQLLEASTMYKTNKKQEKDAADSNKDNVVDTTKISGTGSGYTGTPGGNTGAPGGDFANIDSSGKDYGPFSKTSSAPQRNYSQHTKSGAYGLKDGGRIGYKHGGLASIL